MKNVKKASDHKPMTPEEAKEKLKKSFAKTQSGKIEKIEGDAEFGGDWIEVKVDLKQQGIPITTWLKDGKLPFSWQFANGCGRFALVYHDQFQPAHEWYEEVGLRAGFMVKRNTGWEYGLEVIALHKKYQAGETAESQSKKREKNESPIQKIKRLEHLLSDSEQKALKLQVELQKVCGLYRETKEGANYESVILNAVLNDEQQQQDSVQDEKDNDEFLTTEEISVVLFKNAA